MNKKKWLKTYFQVSPFLFLVNDIIPIMQMTLTIIRDKQKHMSMHEGVNDDDFPG